MEKLTRWRKAAALVRDFGAPEEIDAHPEMYRLLSVDNISSDGGAACAKIEPHELRRDKIPLLFIHGVEYGGRKEVIRDLVKPFLDHSHMRKDGSLKDYDICFVSWNSSLVNRQNHPRFYELKDDLPTHIWLTLAINYLNKFFTNVERRAEQVSRYLDPYVEHFWRPDGALPQVITHSLGSYVWADLVQRHAAAGALPYRLGRWLNLQPAIPANGFCRGGRFDRVADAYNHRNACQEVWFSKLDVVLGSLYWAVTKQRAMGLVGARQRRGIPHVDMTWISAEAHGALSLRPRQGCFLQRAGRMLRSRFAFCQMPDAMLA